MSDLELDPVPDDEEPDPVVPDPDVDEVPPPPYEPPEPTQLDRIEAMLQQLVDALVH